MFIPPSREGTDVGSTHVKLHKGLGRVFQPLRPYPRRQEDHLDHAAAAAARSALRPARLGCQAAHRRRPEEAARRVADDENPVRAGAGHDRGQVRGDGRHVVGDRGVAGLVVPVLGRWVTWTA